MDLWVLLPQKAVEGHIRGLKKAASVVVGTKRITDIYSNFTAALGAEGDNGPHKAVHRLICSP